MIKDRIIQILELKGIPKENFYKKIGVTSANFRGKAKEGALASITIEKILTEIPDINLYWLITGEGEMFRTSTTNTAKIGDNKGNIGNNINGNINGNNGNITISHNDFTSLIDIKKGFVEIERELINSLQESQSQLTILLEILKSKAV